MSRLGADCVVADKVENGLDGTDKRVKKIS